MTLIYRMEDRHHHGPFSLATAKQYGDRAAMKMWRHVPWADAGPDGLAAMDRTHPHHIRDILGGDDFDAYMAEFLGLMPLQGNWLVGCRDLRQFYHWFPKQALPDFAHCGLELAIYDCPDCAIKWGRYQLMFDPKQAKLVKREPLTEPLRAAA